MQKPNTVGIIYVIAVAAIITAGVRMYFAPVRDAGSRPSDLNHTKQIGLAEMWEGQGDYDICLPLINDPTGRSWRAASEPYMRNDGLPYSGPPCGFGMDVKDAPVVSDPYKISRVANTTGVGRTGLNSAPFTPDLVQQELAKVAHPEWTTAVDQSPTR